jgi:hypothetical protein
VLVRGAGTGVIMAITGYRATVVSANFVTDVSDFISFLLYIVIPWSAINLGRAIPEALAAVATGPRDRSASAKILTAALLGR